MGNKEAKRQRRLKDEEEKQTRAVPRETVAQRKSKCVRVISLPRFPSFSVFTTRPRPPSLRPSRVFPLKSAISLECNFPRHPIDRISLSFLVLRFVCSRESFGLLVKFRTRGRNADKDESGSDPAGELLFYHLCVNIGNAHWFALACVEIHFCPADAQNMFCKKMSK